MLIFLRPFSRHVTACQLGMKRVVGPNGAHLPQPSPATAMIATSCMDLQMLKLLLQQQLPAGLPLTFVHVQQAHHSTSPQQHAVPGSEVPSIDKCVCAQGTRPWLNQGNVLHSQNHCAGQLDVPLCGAPGHSILGSIQPCTARQACKQAAAWTCSSFDKATSACPAGKIVDRACACMGAPRLTTTG